MEDLIIKYLEGTLSDEERRSLDNWIRKNYRNRRVFENIVNHWEVKDQDVKASKERVLTKIKKNKSFSSYNRKRSRFKLIVRYAAVFILGLFLSTNILDSRLWQIFLSKVETKGAMITKTAKRGKKLTFQLPDNTTIKLNSGSSITYPEKFKIGTRQVELQGEAYFQVKRDETAPFIVNTSNLIIEVLGTSFNINSGSDDLSGKVAVRSGKVMVKGNNSSKSVILSKGQWSSLTNGLVKESIQNEDEHFGWTKQKLVFNNTPIPELITKLENWFDVDIIMARELDHEKGFTAVYKRPTLMQVLESLSFSYSFEYEIKNKNVVIK